ncbi:hypothetical protein [Bacillus horti]|uniref:Uncharacterized protein n=1 Tax=Caldalkalibacillus horti TaxID=77523 RepID=A0ABT9VW20_9BACI|nr:hypothetical protein [Bacillus horti]MDQ0165164.1 hypothetical protein [Bacillus horti]
MSGNLRGDIDSKQKGREKAASRTVNRSVDIDLINLMTETQIEMQLVKEVAKQEIEKCQNKLVSIIKWQDETLAAFEKKMEDIETLLNLYNNQSLTERFIKNLEDHPISEALLRSVETNYQHLIESLLKDSTGKRI